MGKSGLLVVVGTKDENSLTFSLLIHTNLSMSVVSECDSEAVSHLEISRALCNMYRISFEVKGANLKEFIPLKSINRLILEFEMQSQMQNPPA